MNFQPLLSAREFLGVIHGPRGIRVDKRIPLYSGVGKRLATHNTDLCCISNVAAKGRILLETCFYSKLYATLANCIF